MAWPLQAAHASSVVGRKRGSVKDGRSSDVLSIEHERRWCVGEKKKTEEREGLLCEERK